MSDYVILTDSSCDLPQAVVDSYGVEVVPLAAIIDGKSYLNYLDEREISIKDFYRRLQSGVKCSTSAVNTSDFLQVMEEILQKGKDVLYLGFSSALSGTYSAGDAAAKQLAKKYPDRKIICVDTLCASLGEGLLVTLTAQKQQQGYSLEQAAQFAEDTKLSLCHWFTVDDLGHLKRGGRISASAAAVGTLLKIKPVMHMDNEGRLVNMEKAHGRMKALNRLVEKMRETAVNPQDQLVYICHSECLEEAQKVAEKIKATVGAREILINSIGPVIGTHTGVGTISIFFLGTHR